LSRFTIEKVGISSSFDRLFWSILWREISLKIEKSLTLYRKFLQRVLGVKFNSFKKLLRGLIPVLTSSNLFRKGRKPYFGDSEEKYQLYCPLALIIFYVTLLFVIIMKFYTKQRNQKASTFLKSPQTSKQTNWHLKALKKGFINENMSKFTLQI